MPVWLKIHIQTAFFDYEHPIDIDIYGQMSLNFNCHVSTICYINLTNTFILMSPISIYAEIMTCAPLYITCGNSDYRVLREGGVPRIGQFGSERGIGRDSVTITAAIRHIVIAILYGNQLAIRVSVCATRNNAYGTCTHFNARGGQICSGISSKIT